MPDEPAKNDVAEAKIPQAQETTTSIDALLAFLKEKGKSELNSIAVKLNVDPRIVEKWAKVLEAGSLVRISYEVGKMYLEPTKLAAEQTQDLKTKTDVTKYIVGEDLAVDKMSLDKYSKNIQDLDISIDNIDKIYKQKLPEVQKILAEVNRAYVPLEAKERSIKGMFDDTQKDFNDINAKADALYAKLNGFSSKQSESSISDHMLKLNRVLDSVKETQKAIEQSEEAFRKAFQEIKDDAESKTRELNKNLMESRKEAEKSLRTNSQQLGEIIKSMKDSSKYAQQIVGEVNTYKKEFERARNDVEVLRRDFTDRYTKMRQGIESDEKIIKVHSEKMNNAVESIRRQFGNAAKFDEDIRKWRKDMEEMTKDITIQKAEIARLTSQLNALDTSRLSVEAKAEKVRQVSEAESKTKETAKRIRGTIKKIAKEMGDRNVADVPDDSGDK